MRSWRGSASPLQARTGAAALAVVVLASLAACGADDSSGSPSSDSPAGDPTEVCTEDRVDAGSSITSDVITPTTTLDPAMSSGGMYGGEEASVLYDTLTRYDHETGLYEPFLAESMTPNEDFTEWTMTLREGVTFGNGDPLTAQDVVYSLERTQSDAGTTPIKAYLGPLTSTEAVDDLTVVFTLNRSWAGFPWILSDVPGMVVNRNVVEARGDGFGSEPTGAGVGPYEFESFAPGEELVLKAKTDYWGGPVCIGTLRFVSVPGASTKLEAFENGEVDVVTIDNDASVTADIDAIEGTHNLHYLRGGLGLAMNQFPGARFTDVRLRQAVAAAMDPDLINQRAFDGDGVMAPTLTVEDMKIWGGVDGVDFDPDRAKELIAEAVADGVDPSIDFVVADTANSDLVLAVEALLENAGFTVNTETLAFAAWVEKYRSQAFDLIFNNNGIGEDGPLRSLTVFQGGNLVNRTGVDDDEVDGAIDDLYTAEGPDEVAAVMAGLQERWNEITPAVPLWAQTITKGVAAHVHGLAWAQEGRLAYEKAYVKE